MRLGGFLLLLSVSASAAEPVVLRYGTPHPEHAISYFSGTGALVVYFHGGAWLAGHKESFAPVGRAFAAHGLAAAVVDYRLSSTPGVRHPEHAKDGAAALHALAKQRLPMVVVGHSAGAHLAATLVTDLSLEARNLVRGVVTTEGIFDVPKLAADFPSYVDWFLTPAFGSDRRRWKGASPRYGSLAGSPPWLLVHSEGDSLVNTAQSVTMVEALRAAQVEATLERIAALEHDEVTEQLSSPSAPLLRRVIDFARRVAERKPSPGSGTGVRRDEK